MEQAIKQHGPAGLVALSLALTGGLVNISPNPNSTLSLQPQWCNKTLQINNSIPTALVPLAVTASLILPMLPLLINSKTHWSEMKTEVTKSHIVGQSVSYGTAELLRHFAINPEANFLQKCNLSLEDCFDRINTNVNLSNLCKNSINNQDTKTLFDSLHHFPDATCTILGASFVSFVSSLAYWHYINKVGKSVYQSSPYVKMALVTFYCILIIFLCIYLMYLYKSLELAHFLSVLLGGGLQLFVSITMLKQTQQDFILTPSDSDKDIEPTSIIKK